MGGGRWDSSTEYPKITVPHKMLEKLEKHRVRVAMEEAKVKQQKLKTLIISAKRKEYQYFKGQKFDTFDPKKLASHGWKHRNCGKDYFTLNIHKPNPAVSHTELEQTFADFHLDESILEYIKKENMNKPTNVQRLLIPKMLAGEHVVCAAETGSGKTYAYLLPLVHNILQKKKVDMYDPMLKNSPDSIILVPSMELVVQLMDICKRMSDAVALNPFMLYGGGNCQEALKNDGQLIDLLISTPGILMSLLHTRRLKISRLSSIVLDEADSLLDDSFYPLVNDILSKLQIEESSAIGDVHVNEGVQVALVSATFPRGMDTTIGEVLPIQSFTKVTTKNLHHIMPHVEQTFLRMRSIDKLETVMKILKQKKMTYMIFCNKTETCRWLSMTLKEQGLDNVFITGSLSDKERLDLYTSFKEGNYNVMVSTDVASRGLDTHWVEHVINFDFPMYMSDYIHRTGRVGRVGSTQQGHVTSFVIYPHDVELVWQLEMAARKDSELQNVDANIKRKITNYAESKRDTVHKDTTKKQADVKL